MRRGKWKKFLDTTELAELSDLVHTRGFWLVNVLWFFGGFTFFLLLPERDERFGLADYILQLALISMIVLPIYWTALVKFGKYLNNWLK